MDFSNAQHLMLLMPLTAVVAIVLAHQQQRLAALRREVEGLRRTALHLESLFDHAPLGMAIFDAELRTVRINRLLAEIDGLGIDDHLGRTAHEVVPDGADHVTAALHKVLRTGEPVVGLVFEGATEARPGIRRAWRQNIHPVRGVDGAVLALATTVEEVTEQQRLADALRESEQRERRCAAALDSVMEVAPVALLLAHDRACRHVTANAAGRRLLRLAPGESPSVTGPGVRAYDVWRDGAPVEPERLPLQVAAASGEPTSDCRLSLRFGPADQVEVLVNAVPLRDESGRVRGSACSLLPL